MKRFHIHVSVKDVEKSVQFYSTLFGQKPIKLKKDYAKWLLDDPRVNFAISARSEEVGVNHLGIQVETPSELEEITTRLKNADLGVYGEGETTCCYSKSNKAWVSDPAGVPWEAYQNMADADIFSAEASGDQGAADEASCCVPDNTESECCE